jgi:hypothetical protein
MFIDVYVKDKERPIRMYQGARRRIAGWERRRSMAHSSKLDRMIDLLRQLERKN